MKRCIKEKVLSVVLAVLLTVSVFATCLVFSTSAEGSDQSSVSIGLPATCKPGDTIDLKITIDKLSADPICVNMYFEFEGIEFSMNGVKIIDYTVENSAAAIIDFCIIDDEGRANVLLANWEDEDPINVGTVITFKVKVADDATKVSVSLAEGQVDNSYNLPAASATSTVEGEVVLPERVGDVLVAGEGKQIVKENVNLASAGTVETKLTSDKIPQYSSSMNDGVYAADGAGFSWGAPWFSFYKNANDEVVYTSLQDPDNNIGWATYEFSEIKNISEIRMQVAPAIGTAEYIKAYISVDGTNWKEMGNLSYTGTDIQWINLVFDGEYAAKYVKVEVQISGMFFMVSEIEVYTYTGVVESVPANATPITQIGYPHGNATGVVIIAGDNKTVYELTEATFSTAKDPQWWQIVVVDKNNTVVKISPNGESSKDVVCPEGGYILGAWSSTGDALAALEKVSLGDVITLYNIDLDEVRACKPYYTVQNAAYTAAPAVVLPEADDSWTYVDGETNGTWQTAITEDGANKVGSYYYKAEKVNGKYVIEVLFNGKLSGTSEAYGNGKGTNIRLWFRSDSTTAAAWDTIMDLSYTGSGIAVFAKNSAATVVYNYGDATDFITIESVIPTAKDGLYVKAVIDEIPGLVDNNDVKAIISVSNKPADVNNCLHSNIYDGTNANAPWSAGGWENETLIDLSESVLHEVDDSWTYVDGLTNGTWQTPLPTDENPDNAGVNVGSYYYKISAVDGKYVVEVLFNGKLSGTADSFGNGAGTNVRVWFHSAKNAAGEDQLCYNAIMDIAYTGDGVKYRIMPNTVTTGNKADSATYSYDAEKPFMTVEYEANENALYVKAVLSEIPNVVDDGNVTAIVTVSNKPEGTNNALHSASGDAAAPWADAAWADTSVLTQVPSIATLPDQPSDDDCTYNFSSSASSVAINTAIAGESVRVFTSNEAIANGNINWSINVVLEKVDGEEYKVVAVYVGKAKYEEGCPEGLGENQILLAVHSSSSDMAQIEQYQNVPGKLTAMSMSEGEKVVIVGLDAGEITAIKYYANEPEPELEVSDTLLNEGDNVVDAGWIYEFIAPSTGTYFVQVIGSGEYVVKDGLGVESEDDTVTLVKGEKIIVELRGKGSVQVNVHFEDNNDEVNLELNEDVNLLVGDNVVDAGWKYQFIAGYVGTYNFQIIGTGDYTIIDSLGNEVEDDEVTTAAKGEVFYIAIRGKGSVQVNIEYTDNSEEPVEIPELNVGENAEVAVSGEGTEYKVVAAQSGRYTISGLGVVVGVVTENGVDWEVDYIDAVAGQEIVFVVATDSFQDETVTLTVNCDATPGTGDLGLAAFALIALVTAGGIVVAKKHR